jgi:hypothetical protein
MGSYMKEYMQKRVDIDCPFCRASQGKPQVTGIEDGVITIECRSCYRALRFRVSAGECRLITRKR